MSRRSHMSMVLGFHHHAVARVACVASPRFRTCEYAEVISRQVPQHGSVELHGECSSCGVCVESSASSRVKEEKRGAVPQPLRSARAGKSTQVHVNKRGDKERTMRSPIGY